MWFRRHDSKARVDLPANGKPAGESSRIAGKPDFSTVTFPLASSGVWKGDIHSVAFEFASEPGTFVEIDTIEIIG
jgi:hypothetical protein